MLNAFAFLKYSIKCMPAKCAKACCLCIRRYCLFVFFYRGRRFAVMQLNVKFRRKEEMLPEND